MSFTPTYFKHGDIDMIFDEKGSSFLAMRVIQWGKEGTESDPEKGKLELRKWTVGAEGEVPLKGFSFLTEDGPHNLAEMLVNNGYGKTKTILRELRARSDFNDSVIHLNEEEEDDSDGEYFDMRDILLDEGVAEEEDV